ncbi:hypothetical protein, partial [Mesorhizobium waimense]|uniref:hypothetical protein n=1 Tax=Mesorhizobium waimense TaxID=1300307 RepID=UPI001ABF72F1
RQTSPNSLFPSIVIVHSTAIVASPNKATVMNCSGLTIRAQPQKNYRPHGSNVSSVMAGVARKMWATGMASAPKSYATSIA